MPIPASGKSRDNAFLPHGDDGLTLVDVGWAGATNIALGTLDALGHTTSDIWRCRCRHPRPPRPRRGLSQIRRQCKTSVFHSADAALLGTVLDSVRVMLNGDAVLHRGPEPTQSPEGLSSDPIGARIS